MANISFSGLASGIDSDALIKATLDARRLAYRPLQQTIDFNSSESKALEEFNTKLLSLNNAIKDFQTLAGSGVARHGASSNEDSVGVSVSNAAPISTTSISVQALAKGATLSFNDRYSSLDAPIVPSLSSSESLTVTVGVGDDAVNYTVDITSTTTLREVIEKLNADGSGKFLVSAVNLGTEISPQYAMVMTSSETGIQKGTITVDPSAGLQALGAFTSYSVDQAADAQFTIAGIGQVTKPTNKISGIIPGVTFELNRADNIPVQISVTDDRDKTTERFEKVIGLINDLVKYSKDKSIVQRNKDTDTSSSYGDLAKTRVDEQAVQAIKQALSDAVSKLGGAVRSFADIGISTERDGTLKFDRDKFLAKIGEDPAGAGNLLNTFADKIGATDGVIAGYTRYQGIIDTSVSSNNQEADSLQLRIDRIEDSLAKQGQALKLLFANLESRVSELNSAGDALSGMITRGGGK